MLFVQAHCFRFSAGKSRPTRFVFPVRAKVQAYSSRSLMKQARRKAAVPRRKVAEIPENGSTSFQPCPQYPFRRSSCNGPGSSGCFGFYVPLIYYSDSVRWYHKMLVIKLCQRSKYAVYQQVACPLESRVLFVFGNSHTNHAHLPFTWRQISYNLFFLKCLPPEVAAGSLVESLNQLDRMSKPLC